jgi:endo-1,3-1,4-beta-glycanase ExoK
VPLVSKALLTAAVMAALSSPALAGSWIENFDSFDTARWNDRNGSNGPFFGCTFRPGNTNINNGKMEISILDNGPSIDPKQCGEISTKSKFGYGKYLITMTPSYVNGSDSAFFLYTGDTGGAANHYEIDVEFIVKDGQRKLHTNYFVKGSDFTNGKSNIQQFDVGDGPVQVGFEWRSDSIRWFYINGAGKEVNYRTAKAKIPTQMNLFVNHWYANNRDANSTEFLGRYDGREATASFDKIEVHY